MSKVLAGLLVIITVLSLCACKADKSVIVNSTAEKTETRPSVITEITETTKPIVMEDKKFPTNTSLYGVNVGGMGQEDAFVALKDAVTDYSLKLTVNKKDIVLTADALELTVSKEKFDEYFNSLTEGESQSIPEILSFNENSIREAVINNISVKPRNATIEYNSTSGAFQIKSASSGLEVNPDDAVDAGKEAVAVLKSTASATVKTTKVQPDITEKSSKAINGKNNANNYLKLNLKYTYAPKGVSSKTVALSKANIASFIIFNENLEPAVSKSAIEIYASAMNDKYNVPGETGKFVTTGGATINVDVTYAGQPVDIEALRDDIYHCVTNNIGGTRTAPYLDKTEVGDMSFGGNYVEVDMSSQNLWVYKNGKCVVSTPVVTGCAYYGMTTPRGVYKINNKMRYATLVGENYETVVEYWMAFIGNGYGLHDAGWRPSSDFGGDTYLYDGSHGCVNIPLGIMPEVYNNASVGTHVILYGGATSASPLKQTLSGTSKVSTALDKTFKLDVKPKYSVDEITYTVKDSSILTVSKNGTVTPKALGTTTVTVTAPKQQFYTKATFTVTITVTDPCLDRGHTCKIWTTSTAPTCTTLGIETGICDRCKKTVEQEIHPTGHSFKVDQEFCINGCGEINPNYMVPTEPSTTVPTTTEDYLQ